MGLTHARDWTEREFAELLTHRNASAEQHHELLPQRTVDAIGKVRSGIHEFHGRGSSMLLSQVMAGKLDKPNLLWTGPACHHVRQ